MRFFEAQEQARAQTLRLLLLFGLAVIALVLAVNGALALTWRLVSHGWFGYPAYFFSVNTGVTLLFVLGGWWLETSVLEGGGQALARQAGAREAWPASREAEQRLCNIVHELAIAASMRPPQAMVLPREDSINAFAAGWDEDDAIVAVTQGALDRLSRDELQGLLAHEFSHLREGDTRLNMRLAGMVCGLEMIFNLGRGMCEGDQYGRRSFLALPGFAIMATGFLGWLAGRALKAAVSRQREFLADARAVQFTRSKEGLGGVLRKAAGERASAARHHGSTAHHLHPAVHHMLLVGAATQTRWFESHPPLAERIRRIYGRPMPVLSAQPDDHAPTRPDALF
ncbi:M48 family metalloprotease [Polaromonas naphthalenivorans]|uniref:Peptidase M48, Ste24p n=1 Tax=Polaromonas naphthalenivorans (strain CJ2) TaxID=365044 RepID=A1VTF5_POLNA|nr:M48 family metalloprotease [Polaromonas naphthalenivorans]ABM38933.1 peptidase M48, Ste24p [Polaromonas naphthalenivorans CJ2]